MSSLIRFRHVPFIKFDYLFNDSRLWLASSSAAGIAQPLDSFRPRLGLHESKDSDLITATFELPGLKSEDIVIDVHHNRLTVSGESSNSNSRKDGEYVHRERNYGKFSRTLQLPFGTKPEDVKAKMESGILTVTFPKSIPEQQPQRIAVQ